MVSMGAPPSLQFECGWQSPWSAAPVGSAAASTRSRSRCSMRGQVVGHLAGQGLRRSPSRWTGRCPEAPGVGPAPPARRSARRRLPNDLGGSHGTPWPSSGASARSRKYTIRSSARRGQGSAVGGSGVGHPGSLPPFPAGAGTPTCITLVYMTAHRHLGPRHVPPLPGGATTAVRRPARARRSPYRAAGWSTSAAGRASSPPSCTRTSARPRPSASTARPTCSSRHSEHGKRRSALRAAVTWRRGPRLGRVDVVFANASLQWVPDHPRLIERLARSADRPRPARRAGAGELRPPDAHRCRPRRPDIRDGSRRLDSRRSSHRRDTPGCSIGWGLPRSTHDCRSTCTDCPTRRA